ncbi:ferredoxin [Kitasatospora sp. RG8]|uniref:ferredoxin n=1 Tax=Kitasatospora sp. RG8 TaxID=2820815 RepID=UPI0027DB53E6|nr:ferredoxin [Kitasatospora sp. RG8]
MTADSAGTAGRATDDPVVVRVDHGRCVGSGMCALAVPGSLVLGADGLAHPVRAPRPDGAPPVGEPLTAKLAEAVGFCPVEALTLYSARDGRRIAHTR